MIDESVRDKIRGDINMMANDKLGCPHFLMRQTIEQTGVIHGDVFYGIYVCPLGTNDLQTAKHLPAEVYEKLKGSVK